MDRNYIASELVEAAREVTGNRAGDILSQLVPERDMRKVLSSVDPMTKKQGIRVYKELQKRMQLTGNENAALNKLLKSTEEPEIASVLFQGAADSLGIR